MGVPAYVALQMLAEGDGGQGLGDGEQASIPHPPSPIPQSPFNPRTRNALLSFLRLLDELIAARETKDLGELMDLLFGRIEFQEVLLREHGEDEGRDRWNNVGELRNVAANYVNLPREAQLPTFLEEVALVSDVDAIKEERDAITCITLHQAKGLEYPVVFVVGLEEGLLPHSRSLDDREALEEERRLFYVGATRAKQRLYLLYAFRRTSYGRTNLSQPSRFLADIPKALVKQPLKRGQASVQQTSMFTNRGLGSLGGTNRVIPGRAAPTIPQRPAARPQTPRDTSFFAGQKVRHALFGEGIVVSSKIVENDEEVTVAFTGKGVKRLLASFAKLERAD
jgi:DNA helicase-2/ATP-dependent DNA helicase PcrA